MLLKWSKLLSLIKNNAFMFLFKRLLNTCMVLTGVILLVFLIFQVLGDPAKLIAGQSGDKNTMDNIRKSLYLDQPKYKQLILFVNDISPISIYDSIELKTKELHGFFIGTQKVIGIKLPYFGKSYQSKKDVLSILLKAFPLTMLLAFSSIIFATIIGILLGIVSAINKNKAIDHIGIFISNLGVSTPSFFLAIIIAYLFGIILHQYSGLNFTGSLYEIDEVTGERIIVLKNLILPALTLGIRPLSVITQMTRSSMIDTMNLDFIRTAKAYGIQKNKIIVHYALRNAIPPVITTILGWFAELLTGAFFVEYVFGWNGLGKITVDALSKLDYPLVLGSVILSALIFSFMNIFTDIVQNKMNPNI